jgi:hypothetical protein
MTTHPTIHRRPLTAGIAQSLPGLDPTAAARFITGESPTTVAPPPAPADRAPRAPLTTRLRADYVAALKRVSLERQLNGQTPHTVQEFLEEALGPWLEKHGYLP